MSVAVRFAKLSWNDRFLLGEAMLCLAIASLLISTLSFRRIARFATSGRTTIDPAPAPFVMRIAWALNACANRVPWKAKCFQRALAAEMMLRRRGLAVVLNYGVRRDDGGGLAAHVWTRSGDIDIIGCGNADDFQLLMALESCDRPS